jgi:aminopeptidase N
MPGVLFRVWIIRPKKQHLKSKSILNQILWRFQTARSKKNKSFRENLLLYYPHITSKSGEERICEVIAHEIAHQWFGNPVTPSDWSTWEQFLHGQTGSAMARDSLHETFAIEIPGGEHIVINASTAPIIYNKGGSILRQVQGHIGDENFKNGLQHHLKTYEYKCASSHHLWESFETVSNQPIRSMMKSWIEQP